MKILDSTNNISEFYRGSYSVVICNTHKVNYKYVQNVRLHGTDGEMGGCSQNVLPRNEV
jgi:hypothetical protein